MALSALALRGMNGLGTAHHAVGGDEELAVESTMRSASESAREAAEDDGVDGADAGAGQHGDGQFRDHRHVDGNPVALLDTPCFLRTLANLQTSAWSCL
jgi:hypothetical protein